MSELWRLAELLISDKSLWTRSNLNYILKSDDSPVSSVDLALDQFISDFLESEFPGVWIVSEEYPLSFLVPQVDILAQVDPLDGTENFVSGLPIWGVSVAIWKLGTHYASMLVFPELGLSLSTGDRGISFSSRIVGHPSSSPLESLDYSLDQRENRILGSASFNLFCVATGRFSRFINRTGAHSWDIVAGLNLAKENGCRVTVEGEEYRGEFLDPNRKYCFEVFK